jgi:inner membrane protein
VATIFSHSIAALAVGKAFPLEPGPKFWVLTAVLASLPDIDVLGFSFGIRYSDMLGHRGFTHSLPFAVLLACLVVLLAYGDIATFSTRWFKIVTYFAVVIASHGILDAMTNGGLGVAFFAPFSNERYFFPWRPIEVSPLGIEQFLSGRGLEVLISEIKWIWIPSALLVTAAAICRLAFKRSALNSKPDSGES